MNTTDETAESIAAAIDAHGESDCLLVAKFCVKDGWVNGSANKGVENKRITYIFGNEETFSRILSRAKSHSGSVAPKDSRPPRPSAAYAWTGSAWKFDPALAEDARGTARGTIAATTDASDSKTRPGASSTPTQVNLETLIAGIG